MKSFAWCACFVCISAALDANPVWYISNAAGMALEGTAEVVALRSEYALSVETLSSSFLPEKLRPYYTQAWNVEKRSLYHHAVENRVQWRFVDSDTQTRLSAVLDGAGAGTIDIYDSSGRQSEERRIDAAGNETVLQYFYQGDVLLRSVAQGLYTDTYRYTRSGSIRAVIRSFDEGTSQRIDFPRLSPPPFPGLGDDFVQVRAVWTSSFLSDVLDSVVSDGSGQIVYTIGSGGKPEKETHYDAEGNEVGVLAYTWDGNRIASVRWIAGDDERLTEYEYDADGNQTSEKDYSKGVLERTLRKEGNQEIEELYINGKVALRAVWEEGRKISEERLR
jgi:hypothetical protein